MNYTFKILDWDTDFFGFKVGRLTILNPHFEDYSDIFKLLDKHNVRLTYLTTDMKISNIHSWNNRFEIKLVDLKTTFIKKLTNHLTNDNLVELYTNEYPDPKLIELAIESGVYSRFNIDENIEKSKFHELYKLWIINSVNKKIAKETFVYKNNGEIVGFVTLDEKINRADIGIIAVERNLRGKSIGKTLLSKCENHAFANGFDLIQVVTQGRNDKACKFYMNCGYKIESTQYIYHVWRN